jgi:hypothetical protein
MLASYSPTAHRDFWTEHWGGHTVDELLAITAVSPCASAAGVDGSVAALATARRTAPVPPAASDLRALAIRSGAVAAYVSLGVSSTIPRAPTRSWPRPGACWRRAGSSSSRCPTSTAPAGAFYQYAFFRRELLAALARHGFAAQAAHPYDPARLLRSALPRVVVARGRRRPAAPAGAAPSCPPAAGSAGPRGRLARLVRRALYTEPALRLLGHMLLVVARRP